MKIILKIRCHLTYISPAAAEHCNVAKFDFQRKICHLRDIFGFTPQSLSLLLLIHLFNRLTPALAQAAEGWYWINLVTFCWL